MKINTKKIIPSFEIRVISVGVAPLQDKGNLSPSMTIITSHEGMGSNKGFCADSVL